MSSYIKCGKCGCGFTSKPIVVETGETDKSGNTIYKAIGEDSSCPQCGFGSDDKQEGSFTESGKKQLLCG